MASEEEPPVTVYLDTSVLASWFLHYRKRKWRSFRPDDMARQSMEFLESIIANKYNAEFITSYWATGELYQSALDNLTVVKMIRDGRNPRFFQTTKKHYLLSANEIDQVSDAMDAFLFKIDNLDIVTRSALIDDDGEMRELTFKYGIEAPDALHLSIALSWDCDYFLTIDQRLKDAKVKKPEVMYPSTFDCLPYSKRKNAK